MEQMDYLFEQLIDNFNFGYIIVINIITYFSIKGIDILNKEKKVSTLVKRIVLVIIVIIAFIIYKCYTDIDVVILINSSILAPVSWSWILKPIMKKLGISYKSFDNYIK